MPASPQKNIGWISSIRLIAMYAVIILHCSAPLLMDFGKVPISDWWVADFYNAITRCAVPIFVMVTGALLLNREYEIGDFLKRRLTRVVIPFLFWSLVYVAYSWYNGDITFGSDAWINIKIVLHQLKYGASYHLWYVYMLIGLYFFIPVIGKFVRNASEKETLYFLIVWAAVMLITQPYLSRFNPSVDMHYFAGYAGYLVFGHYLAYKDFRLKHLRAWMLLLFVCAVLVIAIGSKLIIGTSLSGTMFYEPVNPAVVVLSGSIFVVFRYSNPNTPAWIIRFRDFAGRYNYGLYLAHALFLYLLDDPLGISYKMCAPIVAIPVTAAICFILTLGLVWLVNKLPFAGKWISG